MRRKYRPHDTPALRLLVWRAILEEVCTFRPTGMPPSSRLDTKTVFSISQGYGQV